MGYTNWLKVYVGQLGDGVWFAGIEGPEGETLVNVYGNTEELAKANLLKVLTGADTRVKWYRDGTGKEHRARMKRIREEDKRRAAELEAKYANETWEERVERLGLKRRTG